MTTTEANAVIKANPEAPSEQVREYLRAIAAKGGRAGKGKTHKTNHDERVSSGKRGAAKRWGKQDVAVVALGGVISYLLLVCLFAGV